MKQYQVYYVDGVNPMAKNGEFDALQQRWKQKNISL